MAIQQFDDIFPYIGGFGKYQFVMLLASGYVNMLLGMCYYGQLFLVLTPPHWCSSGTDLQTLNKLGYNITYDELTEWTIPKDAPDGDYSKCKRYDINITEVLESGKSSPNTSWPVTNCTYGWNYDFRHYYYPTLTTEFDLVCDRDWIPPFTQSMFFIGCLVGGPIFGWMADSYGRIPASVLANMIAGAFGVWSALAGGYISFTIARFFVGITTDNNCMIIFILAIEYVSAKYRTLVSNMPVVVCLSGIICVIPWLAVGLSNWRTLGIVMSVLHFFSIAFPFVLPESARWLVEVGRIEDARKTIHHVAKVNGKVLNDEFEKNLTIFMKKNIKKSDEKGATVLDLLRTPILRKRFLLLIFLWVTMLITYDGNVRNSETIGGNFFITFTLIGLVEGPGDLLVVWTMDKFGRRYSNAMSMVLAGICMFANTLIPKGTPIWVPITFSLFGRLFITMAVNCGQQYVMEVLPTVGRAQGSSVIHTLGLGAIFVSPYIVYLNRFGNWIPYVILGGVSIIGAISAFYLPETLGEKLPDSLEDGENFFADQVFYDKPWKRLKKKSEVNLGFNAESENNL